MSLSKSAMVESLAAMTDRDKKTCAAVLEALAELVKEELATTGEVTIPGITKLKAKETPARPTRLGVNPFTKEQMLFKSKPAGMKVKSFPVKNIKDVFAR
jgi:nucleoid DNA-binding protein